MPELPDLHVFAKNLNTALSGRKLLKINIVNSTKIKVEPEELAKKLEGNMLKTIYRTGKELRFHFSNDLLLGMHLMLHGKLNFFRKKNDNKFTVAELYFNEKGLALSDYQGLATITLNPEDKKGVDALSKSLNYDYLKSALQSRAKIKKVITDQNVIRGIGNAYADEILWEARIHPDSVSSAISENKIILLQKAIKTVLEDAVKQILAKDPGIISGEIRDFLKIHTREKDKSPGGAIIRVEKKGGRSTYYTEEQELFL